MPKLAELEQQITGALIEARNIAADAEKANRDMTGEERSRVTELLAKGTAWKDQLVKAKGDDALRDAIKGLGEGIGLNDGSGLQIDHDGATFLKDGKGTTGERFFKSDGYSGWLKRNSRADGTVPDSMKNFRSDGINLGGLKALITGASETSAGALVQPDRQPGILADPWRTLTIRNLITVGQTTSDSVEYTVELLEDRVNNAAPVPEATSAEPIDGTVVTAVKGGRKPQSGFGLDTVKETVRTLAHWVPATKRALSDAGQVRTLIDNFLLNGLDEKLEDEILFGDGTGEHFVGILETDGITAQPWSATLAGEGLSPYLETTLKAKTKVRTVGKATPTAYVLNAEDWEKIQLARLAKNPANEATAGGVETLHGLPVVLSEAMPAGQGMVADWRRAVVWDREQATVVASDQHADFFVRNLVAFLAELRAAFGVLRPAAFVAIDLTA